MTMKRTVPRVDLSIISQIDWARLAAFLDGEGSISISYAVHRDPNFQGRRKRHEYVRLTIANTDPRLIRWLTDTFGGAVRARAYQRCERWKPTFWWVVTCKYATEILEGCLPYFVMKRERAEIAIALQATMRRSGRGGTPVEVIERREQLASQLKVLNMRGPSERAS